MEIIEAAGLKVFPIYQTYGGEVSYFTRYQGQKDAYAAKYAAQSFGFPSSTTIYFAVDYDALMADITSNIIPYFRGIREVIGSSYTVGAYAPRAVCKKLKSYGLITRSFVADMSSSYTGNIGVAIPSNWAYDQIVETTAGGIGIDKCIASSRSTAVSPSEFVTYDLDDNSLSEVEISKAGTYEVIYTITFDGDKLRDYVKDNNLTVSFDTDGDTIVVKTTVTVTVATKEDADAAIANGDANVVTETTKEDVKSNNKAQANSNAVESTSTAQTKSDSSSKKNNTNSSSSSKNNSTTSNSNSTTGSNSNTGGSNSSSSSKTHTHKWDGGTITIQATCTAPAVKTYHCKDCDYCIGGISDPERKIYT